MDRRLISVSHPPPGVTISFIPMEGGGSPAGPAHSNYFARLGFLGSAIGLSWTDMSLPRARTGWPPTPV